MNWVERGKKFIELGKEEISNSNRFSGGLNNGLHKKGTFGLMKEESREISNIRTGVELLFKGLVILNGFSVYRGSKFKKIEDISLPTEDKNTIGLEEIEKNLNLLKITQEDNKLFNNLLNKDLWLRKKSGDARHGTADPAPISEEDFKTINRLLVIVEESLK